MELKKNFSLALDDEMATQDLGKALALIAKKSDTIALMGDLGAGKTTLARAFIQHFFQKPNLEVPSPTFNIVLEYNEKGARAPLYHFDLYRLSDQDELYELGFEEALSNGIALIEWPENAGDMLGDKFLVIQLRYDENKSGRVADFYEPHGFKQQPQNSWAYRWQRHKLIDQFLQKNLSTNFQRHHMMGDASLRHYELIETSDETFILMNDKGRDGGAILENNKTYAEIAHITLTIKPFIGVCNLLRENGFCAPKIYDFDLDEGLILLEHLGNEKIVTPEQKPIEKRYQKAVEFLAHFHEKKITNHAPIKDKNFYKIPKFDRDAMRVEIALFLDWYLPRFSTKEISQNDKNKFYEIWSYLIDKAQGFEANLLLRDYHSPNIIWREDRHGFDQIGLIDFQDAMIGPTSYDVISICNDARVDISASFEQNLKQTYIEHRHQKNSQFNVKQFDESYAIMAAHRATKILGGFVRSDERDGKPIYLAYLPRMQDYLNRALRHPTLNDYKAWMAKHGLLEILGDEDQGQEKK